MKTNKILILLIIFLTIAISGWLIIDTVTESDYEQALPTTVSMKKAEIDLGTLQQGKPRAVTFTILNTGKKPLFIKHVESSCGCTVPEWTKKPVKPDSTAKIKVTYDAKYPGRFIKQIKVFCNIENGLIELRIKGKVSAEDVK